MMFDLPFELPNGWEVKTVDQLINDDVLDKPLDGNHGGTHPKSADYVAEGIPFVMASDLEAGKVNLNSCKFITEKQALTLRKGFSKVGDVLISHKATIGRTAIVQDNEYDFIMLTPQVTYYRVKNDFKLNNVYLKAYFDSVFFQTILMLWAGAGSTRAYLGITAQLKLPIIVPPIDKQLSIAKHVSAINDKIQLNHQTNQTLEQIAQALFKSWFVDFEPVKAKIIAQQKGGDEKTQTLAAQAIISGALTLEQLQALTVDKVELETQLQTILTNHRTTNAQTPETLQKTAELFPNALVESELGEVPEGWEVKPLDNIAHYQNGLALQKFRPEANESSLPVLKIAQLKKGFADGEERASANIKPECIVDNGDVVFSWSGSLLVDVWCGGTVALNQHLFKVTSSEYPKWFYYCWTKKHLETFQQIAADKAVTMGHIKRSHLAEAMCAVPDASLEDFGIIGNLLEKQIKQRLESSLLNELRDTLLPKLLSGEISLNEVATKEEVTV